MTEERTTDPENVEAEVEVEVESAPEGAAESMNADETVEPIEVEGTVAEGTLPADAPVEDISGEDIVIEADDGAPEEEPLSPEAALIIQLEAELAEAQAEMLGQVDKLQRLAAEYQNSKKRQERQLSDAIQRAASHTVERLLPVLDDFDLAFGNIPEDLSAEDASWVEGFRQIQGKLASILEDQGLTAITRDGEFDPNLHEAITSEPNDDVESGQIIETLRVGYEFKGRVLRPAMVRVAS